MTRLKDTQQNDRDPYAEGVEAAHSGKMAAHCPYPYDSAAGEQWMKGFEDAGGSE